MKRINTKQYEKIIDAVYIDDRENKRKDYGLKQYVSLNPSIQHLDIGDYIFKGFILFTDLFFRFIDDIRRQPQFAGNSKGVTFSRNSDQ